jgi:hypothetical protein
MVDLRDFPATGLSWVPITQAKLPEKPPTLNPQQNGQCREKNVYNNLSYARSAKSNLFHASSAIAIDRKQEFETVSNTLLWTTRCHAETRISAVSIPKIVTFWVQLRASDTKRPISTSQRSILNGFSCLKDAAEATFLTSRVTAQYRARKSFAGNLHSRTHD